MSTVMEREKASSAAGSARIRLTANDRKRLQSLLWSARRMGPRNRSLLYLEQAVEAAVIVAPHLLPSDVVSVNSRVRFRDTTHGKIFEYTLVFPAEASVFDGRVSILSPVGCSLLGCSVGEKVTCRAPGGDTVLKILAVLSQPEAAGQY